MRKKFSTTLLTLAMMLLVTACGARETTNNVADTSTQEVVVASSEVVESTVAEATPTPTPAATATPTPEADDRVASSETVESTVAEATPTPTPAATATPTPKVDSGAVSSETIESTVAEPTHEEDEDDDEDDDEGMSSEAEESTVAEPTPTPTPAATATPAPEVDDGVFTIEDGMAKIDRLLEAHTILLSQDKMLENHVQYDTENISATCYELKQCTTADGLGYQRNIAIYATAIIYYNEYVNNNGEYYDFEEWLNAQTDSEAIIACVPGIDKAGNTNDVILFEAIGLIPYLKNCKSVEGVELVETTEFTISDISSAYTITLACDDVNEFKAIYDGEGNLLNISSIDENWNGYMYSFDDFTIEDGMAKIDRLLDAHTVLLSQGKTLEDYVQYDTENLTTECYKLDQFKTADGEGYELNKAIWATAIAYYNEYVNNIGEYYDFEEWLKLQANDDAIVALVPGLEAESGSAYDIMLMEAISLIAYMKSCDTVEGVELKTTEYGISYVPGVYTITLACNGVNELEAVYDLKGNLLNIWSIDDNWNKYVSSFPDRDMEIK